MTIPAPRQLIDLWVNLQEATQALNRVHVWGFEPQRMSYWPGADLHPVPTLVLCCQGRQMVESQGHAKKPERLELEAGQALIIAPGVCHSHPMVRGDFVVFHLGFMHKDSDYQLENRDAQMMGRVPAHPYRGIMDQLIETHVDQRLDLMRSLLALFLDERRHVHHDISPALEAMQLYMQYHAHLPINADDIVHASGLQHAQAYSIWCDFYQAPPFQILQQRRIEIAKANLRAGMELDEAALCSGFTGKRSMDRAFGRFEGRKAQHFANKKASA